MQTRCVVYIGATNKTLPKSRLGGLSKFLPKVLGKLISNRFSLFQKQAVSNIEAIDWSIWVESVTVHQSDNKVAAATITIRDPYLAFFDYFAPTMFVEIHLGWNTPKDEIGRVFKGVINKVGFTLKADGNSTISLSCLGDEIALASGANQFNSFSSSGIDGFGEEGGVGIGGVDLGGTGTGSVDEEDMGDEAGVVDGPETPGVDDVEKKLDEIAKRAGLKLRKPIVIRVKCQSTRISQNIEMTKSDLQRLYQLADDHYAIWYVDGSELVFKDLVSFVRERKPSYNFVFNAIDNTNSALTSLFGSLNTKALIPTDNGTDIQLTGKSQFLIDSVELVEPRSVKEFVPLQDAVTYDDKTGNFVVYGKQGEEPKQYRLSSSKMDKLERDEPEKFDQFVRTLGRDTVMGVDRFNEIKQYMDLVVPKKMAPTDRSNDNKQKRATPPSDFLGSGAKVTLPFGSWKIKAIESAQVIGISHYSDVYYVSEVEHHWTRMEYKQTVTMWRIFDTKKFVNENIPQLRGLGF